MTARATKGLLGALAVLAVGVGPVLAASGADTVKARVQGFRELGAAFKGVNDELRGSTPQQVVLQQSARQIRNTATQIYGWFPAGSGAQAGVKTKALPAIWSNAAGFKTAQDNFAKQANAFNAAVMSKDVNRIRASTKALGATCAACHKQFRSE
jgi:cytochrome c556